MFQEEQDTYWIQPHTIRFESSTSGPPAWSIQSLALVLESDEDLAPEKAQDLRHTFESYLLSSKGYRIVDRERMDEIMAEQELSISDLTEHSDLLGQLSVVEGILVVEARPGQGWVPRWGESYGGLDFRIKLLSVQTGQSVWNSSGFVPRMHEHDAESLELALRDLPAADGTLLLRGHLKRNDGPDQPVIVDALALSSNGQRVMSVRSPTGEQLYELWDFHDYWHRPCWPTLVDEAVLVYFRVTPAGREPLPVIDTYDHEEQRHLSPWEAGTAFMNGLRVSFQEGDDSITIKLDTP